MFWKKARRERLEKEVRNADLYRALDNRLNSFKKELEAANDEIELLNKLVTKKETKIVQTTIWCFTNTLEAIEDQRAKCRAEGFSYCHKMRNGDEIWAKY